MEIPGYRIHEELARDAWHVVWRGEGRGAAVFLKLPLSPSPHPTTIASLRREHELMAALDVEGVPVAHAFEPQQAALIFEDIGAVLLKTMLASRRLTVGEFLPIARELATTVGELHRRRIIHRNLSPYSVLIDPKTRRTQVFDFSVASRLPQESQPAHPPQLLRGRLAYMSPEQTGRMNRVVDYRTDLYSLGTIFYEMLTGRPPFQSEDALELVHGHIAKAPLSPSEIDRAIPEGVAEIVMKLLSKTAEARYQSAWGLKADLETTGRTAG